MSGKRAVSIQLVVSIFVFMLSTAIYSQELSSAPVSGSWSAMGPGLKVRDFGISALVVFNGQLIVDGDIRGPVAWGGPAVWNGTSWQPFCDQTFGLISAFCIWEYYLVAANVHADSCGAVHNVAKWDGKCRRPLGNDSAENKIFRVINWDGRLIGCGGKWLGKGKQRGFIVVWDGESWLPLGEEFNGPVSSLAVYNGQLIAGGSFTKIGDAAIRNIAVWDGHTWLPLGSGLNGYVNTLYLFDGKLVAGGGFKKAGHVSAKHIAAWDGSSWAALGKGINKSVYAMTEYNGRLIVGGRFTKAGGVKARRIAAWNGNTWSPLGSGMEGYNPTIWTLAVYEGKLIAGGFFSKAGGIAALNIAAWEE